MDDLEVIVKDVVSDAIDEEKASMSLDAEKPMTISEEAKENEENLEKIAPVDESKALKTRSANKKWLSALLFISINVLAIVFTVLLELLGDDQPTNFNAAWSIFKENWGWGALAILMVLIALFVEALKRFILLNKALNKKLPLISLNASIVCKYYNNITPLAGGGQPFEIYYLRKKGVPVGIASGVPLVAYALNKISYVFVSILFIIIYGFGTVTTAVKVLAIIGIVANLLVPLAIIFFTIMPKISNAVSRFIAKIATKLHIVKDEKAFEKKLTESIVEYADCIIYFLKKSKTSIIISFLCSIAYYVALYSLPYFIIRLCGSNANISWGQTFAYCVICYATVTLLPTPGGSGGAEISFRSIFAGYIATEGMVLWGILSWRMLSYYFFVAIGIILIIAQQTLKFSKKVVTGQIFESSSKEEQISEEDELEPYTPVPTTQPDEDEINSAEVVILTETTIEEEQPPIVETETPSKVENTTETVIEFTAVIESKSTVKITDEKIEVIEKVPEQIQVEELQTLKEEQTIEQTPSEINAQPCETKPSLIESNEQDLSAKVNVEKQPTVEDLKQSTVILEENTPNVTVIDVSLAQTENKKQIANLNQEVTQKQENIVCSEDTQVQTNENSIESNYANGDKQSENKQEACEGEQNENEQFDSSSNDSDSPKE